MPAERATVPLHTQREQLDAVRHEHPSRYVTRGARKVEPLPPWDARREWLRIQEVAYYLRKLYGIPVGHGAVTSWWKRGVHSPTPSDPNRRLYLVTKRVSNYRLVRKSDLLAFLDLE